jgi:predicted phosphodiesterase
VHGHVRELRGALDTCRAEEVETIALLGDLFDRHEQADACAAELAGWDVIGVYGNHEREVAIDAALGMYALLDDTVRLLSTLQEDVVIDGVRFAHEVSHWGLDDPIARMFGRAPQPNGTSSHDARLTFTGHTHHRLARDERGTLDIARGALALDQSRKYLINPGALIIGQFAIWDRDDDVVYFRNVER